MPKIDASTAWLTIRDAAELSRVSEKSIRRYIAQGRLSAARLGPKLIRIDPASLASLSTPLTATPATPAKRSA